MPVPACIESLMAGSRLSRILFWAVVAAAVIVFLSGCSTKVISTPSPAAASARAAKPSEKAFKGAGGAIALAALSQMGVPYSWGGSSPEKGFDCSGLAWWAAKKNGVAIPRPSWKQYQTGKPVAESELQPGDLVFYRIVSKGPSLHVGIFTDDGFFVHSPKSGSRVREDWMGGSYWKKRFKGARRIVE